MSVTAMAPSQFEFETPSLKKLRLLFSKYALHSIVTVNNHICSVLPASLDPLHTVFAYSFVQFCIWQYVLTICKLFLHCLGHALKNRSTDDAIAFTLRTALSHLENKNTYVRMLFVDYSSAFNTIVPATLVCEAPDSGTEQISVQLDPGLPDRQKSGGQNGQQHLISPDPQHWCTAGLLLSPLLYSLYTHDCTATHSSNIIVKFADDTTVISLITDNDEMALQRGGEYPD